MERFVKGDVVVIPFPYSDLSDSKKRPALVLYDSGDRDILLCQITSKVGKIDSRVSLDKSDFKVGLLPLSSFIRPNRLFSAQRSIVLRKLWTVSNDKYQEVRNYIVQLLDG